MVQRWIARLSFLLFGIAGLGAIFVWFKLSGGFIPRTDLETLAGRLEPSFRVAMPDAATFGPGPYPAILLFHGCGGLTRNGKPRPVTDDYARLAAESGAIAVTVDSFGPRDIDEEKAQSAVCSGWILRGAERAADVAASIAAVRKRDDVDGAWLALAGWSHGSWTIMDALTFNYVDNRPHGLTDAVAGALAGVRFVFLGYPHCAFPARTRSHGWAHEIPALAMLGENDELTPKEPCLEAFETVSDNGGDIKVTIMPGATHAFDERDLENHPDFVFDPDATAMSHSSFVQAIETYLKP